MIAKMAFCETFKIVLVYLGKVFKMGIINDLVLV